MNDIRNAKTAHSFVDIDFIAQKVNGLLALLAFNALKSLDRVTARYEAALHRVTGGVMEDKRCM